MDIIQNALVEKDMIQNVIDNIEYNKTILFYYEKYALEMHDDYKSTLINRRTSLELCNKFWVLDKYEMQKIKDLKSQNLCHDKFCSNCKKVKQAARMSKYIPELEKYSDRLHHLVLTQPNVPGAELKSTIKHMSKCFRNLILYINGSILIKGLDFSRWNYEGAVRSLEITYRDDMFHPHYHVGLIISPSTVSRKNISNIYSFDLRKGLPELTRLFSEEEILIQKIWYLLINKIKVTKENIDDLEEGYSCIIDKFAPDEFAELFKYMTKDKDEKGELLTYNQFKTLYEALYRVKQIQGYGVLYRITDDLNMEEFDALYKTLIEEIAKKESPASVLQKPQELILDSRYKVISRKSYFRYLRTL